MELTEEQINKMANKFMQSEKMDEKFRIELIHTLDCFKTALEDVEAGSGEKEPIVPKLDYLITRLKNL